LTDKKQFSGCWAIILGGSSGFGFASAEKLAQHGMNIAVIYREMASADKSLKKNLEKIASANEVKILPFNINALDAPSRENFIQKFVDEAGKKNCVKLLLHSIARGNLKPLVSENSNFSTDKNDAEILSIEDIQLTTYAMGTSLLDWARTILNHSLFCGDARIIGLTSEGAHKYWDGYAAVSIAKASLESLAKYMAIELSKFGLRTNVIQAGVTVTPSLKKIPSSKKLIELSAKRNPFGRMTEPKDVANVVYLLCTDEAAWINGTLIHADGGEHLR
jgi:enoyl-[acyl-carrier protein] reductase III